MWFQKGQEVSELVSISLDPNIVIQEHDQYVSIRGALQLTGEYRIEENTSEDDDRDFTSVRVVNEVVTREDGVSVLSHNFPVDITIPKNRIQNLDDVYVAIESFDYELPKRGCLELVADLSISGIYGNQQSVPSVEETQEEARPVELNYPASYSPETVDVTESVASPVEEAEKEPELAFRASQEDEPVVKQPEVTFNSNDVFTKEDEDFSPRSLLNEDDSTEVETVNMDLYSIPDHSSDDKEEDLYTPFEVEARKEIYSEVEEEVVEENTPAPDEFVPDALTQFEEEVPAPEVLEVQEPEPELEPEPVKQPQLQVEFKGRPEEKYHFGESKSNSKAVAAVEEREVGQGQEEPVKRSENALSLTKIFTREDEEDFTKMKICIAQHNDSLETISERYEVSVQALLRVNQLSEDIHINDGQLLYIPVSK